METKLLPSPPDCSLRGKPAAKLPGRTGCPWRSQPPPADPGSEHQDCPTPGEPSDDGRPSQHLVATPMGDLGAEPLSTITPEMGTHSSKRQGHLSGSTLAA